jgi:ATP-dependent DNA helicase RecQ
MGVTLLSDPLKIQQRWNAMWESRLTEVEGVFSILISAKPVYQYGIETYDENIRWNKRLLLLMQRAELISITNISYVKSDNGLDFVERASLRLLKSSLSMEDNLSLQIEQQRANEYKEAYKSFNTLLSYFDKHEIICRKLCQYFGKDTERSCGSCESCRSGISNPRKPGVLVFDITKNRTKPFVNIVQINFINIFDKNKLIESIRKILRLCLVRRFFVCSESRLLVEELFDKAEDNTTASYRIDEIEKFESYEIQDHERLVVFHFNKINENLNAINRCGSLVSHWLLGGEIESIPGRWPFMHEFHSRPYYGVNSLSTWINDIAI